MDEIIPDVEEIITKNYVPQETFNEFTGQIYKVVGQIDENKANSNDVYTKTEVDEKIANAGGGGGGSVPEGLEQRLGEIEEDIRVLQQGLDGTLGIANSASQTATGAANTINAFTSYAEENYATKSELKNNHYTKAEVDAKIANAGGGGNDKYEYVRDDSLVYLVGDSETGKCQTLYIKEDSTGYAKDFLGIFGGEYDI